MRRPRSIVNACKALGLPRQTLYDYRHADPEFEQACKDAKKRDVDELLEESALYRAIHGTKRPTFYKGAPIMVGGKVVFVTEYETALTIFLMKKRMPEKYGDSEGGAEKTHIQRVHQDIQEFRASLASIRPKVVDKTEEKKNDGKEKQGKKKTG